MLRMWQDFTHAVKRWYYAWLDSAGFGRYRVVGYCEYDGFNASGLVSRDVFPSLSVAKWHVERSVQCGTFDWLDDLCVINEYTGDSFRYIGPGVWLDASRTVSASSAALGGGTWHGQCPHCGCEGASQDVHGFRCPNCDCEENW